MFHSAEMHPTQLPLLVLAFLASICQADLLQYSGQIPPCGAICLFGTVQMSACLTLGNTTCICTDPGLDDLVTQCVLQRCSTEEILVVLSVQDKACDRPIRSRRNELWSWIALEVITLVCVGLRMFSRWRLRARYESDDYVMLVLLLAYLAFTVLGQYARLTAFGVDMWTLNSQTITTGLKIFFIDETFYLIVLALSKVVILCFLLRIFPNTWLRRSTYGVMAFIGVTTTIFMFLQIFQCTPISYNWDGWKGKMPDHKCMDLNLMTITAAAVTILEDVLILALPLPVIVGLRVNWRKKAGILFMFSLGAFVLIISCVRLRYVIMFQRSTNPTWDYMDTLFWTTLEVNISMIVACLPSLRALLSTSVPKFLGSTASPTRKSRSGGPTSRSKLSGVFGSNGATRIDDGYDDQDSHLELGDRQRGTTQTEIGVGYKRSDDGASTSSDTVAIVVKTTFILDEKTVTSKS